MAVTSEKTPILRSVDYVCRLFDISPRYVIAAMVFLGFMVTYILRVTLSVAILTMTTPRQVVHNGRIYQEVEFNWDKKTQGMILGSFFAGYIMSQIIGGYLARRFGGGMLFGLGVIGTSIFTICTPSAAYSSKWILIIFRVIEGIFEGVIYPSSLEIWSVWAPVKERAQLVTLGFSGSYVGTVVGMAGTGFIITVSGWPAVFFITGVAGIVWGLSFLFFMKRMDRHLPESKQRRASIEFQKGEVPWKKLLCSAPVWAIIVAHSVENWGFYTMLTELPTFLHYAGYSKSTSLAGEVSSLPYLVMALSVPLAGALSDYAVNHTELTVTCKMKKFYK